MGSDGGADIGAINDRGRLRQRHDADIDETDDHHGDSTRTLYGSRANGSDAYAHPFALAHSGKKLFQPAAARVFKMGAHHVAGHQKDADASSQSQNRSKYSDCIHRY